MPRKNNRQQQAKQSKQQKQEYRREEQMQKKAERLSKRQQKRKQHQLDMKKYEEDMTKFRQQLHPLCLKVKEMNGDGNCMFRTVADQLEGQPSLHAVYRQRTVEFILENQEMYKFFIEDDETIEEYCKDMAKDGIWGGQIEMNALAMVYQFNAIIHQVDHPSLIQSFHEIGAVPTIHMSFHLGEHYNSVRRGDDPCTDGINPVQDYPIGHDLDAVKAMLQGQELNLDTILEDDKKAKKEKKQQKDSEEYNNKDMIPKEVLNYARDFVGSRDPDMKVLQTTLEEFFTERNLSKLKLKDIDHNKKKIKQEYNENILLQLANLQIAENEAAIAADFEEYKEEDEKEANKENDGNKTADNDSKKKKEKGEKKNGKGQKEEYDLKYLENTLKMLNDDNQICVDPSETTLKNVTIIDRPAANKPCPCGSRSKFKKCCIGKYEQARNDIINQIEALLQNKQSGKKQQPSLIYV